MKSDHYIRQLDEAEGEKTMKAYDDSLDADLQISVEEQIAATIRATIEESQNANGDPDYTLTDEDCADLGRSILRDISGTLPA